MALSDIALLQNQATWVIAIAETGNNLRIAAILLVSYFWKPASHSSAKSRRGLRNNSTKEIPFGEAFAPTETVPYFWKSQNETAFA